MNPDVAKGIEAHRSGRLEEAQRLYKKALRRRAADPDALIFLGVLEFHRGERQRGIELLNRSLAVAPRNPHAWINLGNMVALERNAAEACVAYQRALAIDQALPEAWYNLGVCQRRLQQFDAADRSLRRAIELQPNYPAAYEALGGLLYRKGQLEEAADLYRQWLVVDPQNPVARHIAAATSAAREPPRADDRYVASHFDHFAESFDVALAALGYRAPQLVASALTLHPGYQSAGLEILDAGCGTGLCGPLLRSSARRLIGVDLSAGMLAKARERGSYDELIAAELTAYLASHSRAFDVIVSADTLCYFGDLDPVMRAAAGALKPGGLLVFTVEACAAVQGPHLLQPSGRYAHNEEYLRASIAAASLVATGLERVVLREESAVDVQGWLVTAQRPH